MLCLLLLSIIANINNGEEAGVSLKPPSGIQFDYTDPIASHPEMIKIVESIYDRNVRRGLTTNPPVLTTSEKQIILDKHNEIRSKVALGIYEGPNGRNHPNACNMNELSWSIALEQVAMDWTSRCYFEHSTGCPGHLTKAIQNGATVEWNRQLNDDCGENLYVSGAEPAMHAVYGDRNYGIMGFEDGWIAEESLLYQYNKGNIGRAGHFTQVIWANTRYVGCGFKHCNGVTTDNPNSDYSWARMIFSCNYYPEGNYGNQYPYKEGASCSCCDNDRKVCTYDGGLCGGGFNSNWNNDNYDGDKTVVDRCTDGLGRNICERNGQNPNNGGASPEPTNHPTPSPSGVPTRKPTGSPTQTRITYPPAVSEQTKFAVRVTTSVTWYSFGDNYNEVENKLDEWIFNKLALSYLDLTSTGIDDDNKDIKGPFCATSQRDPTQCRYYYGFYTAPIILQGVTDEYMQEIESMVNDNSYSTFICQKLTEYYYEIDGDLGVRCYRSSAEFEQITQSQYEAFIGDTNNDNVPFDTLNLESYSGADIFVLFVFLGIICCACWCIGWYAHKKRFQTALENELLMVNNFNPQARQSDIKKQMAANQAPDIFEQGIYRIRHH